MQSAPQVELSRMENETDDSAGRRQSSKVNQRQLTQSFIGLLFFMVLLVSKSQAQECKEHHYPEFTDRRELATAASLDPDDILEGHG